MNFSWLANNPSTLLWADKIYVPKTAYETEKGRDETKTEKVVSMFLDMAEAERVIEKFDVTQRYERRFGDDILQKMRDDSQKLLDTFPSIVKKGNPGIPEEILIEDKHYCGAKIASIYLDIHLANDLDANCLFSKYEHTFLKYLYGLKANQLGGYNINNAYNEVFSLYLPESIGIHSYAFMPEDHCMKCIHYNDCKNSYLQETEKAITQIFKWREYDELYQAKEEIGKIIQVKGQITSPKDIDDIIKAFQERQNTINRNIKKCFPKIERWTNMTTVLATPVTIASAIATGNTPLTIGSAVATGLAMATEKYLNYYKSKNNWVGFVNSMKDMK